MVTSAKQWLRSFGTDRFASYIMEQTEMAEWPCSYSKNIFLIGNTKPQYILNHKLTSKGEPLVEYQQR
jgi:hypothetical protein